MQVGYVGDGPAVDAVRTALTDARSSPSATAVARDADADTVGALDLVVVAGTVDDAAVARLAGTARGAATPVVTIELGGIGTHPVADLAAAVAGFHGGTACFECLRQRVAAADPEGGEVTVDAATARFAGAIAGREIVAFLDEGEDPDAPRPGVFGGVIEVPHAVRRLLPVPGCVCHTGRDRALRRTDQSRDLEAALAAAETALDDRVGIVTSVGEAESYPVPYYLATLAETPFSDADVPRHAAGVAADWNPAFMKALGDALERYSAAVYRTASFRIDPNSPVSPARFVRPDDGDPAVEYWHPAEDLETGEPVGLPADVVVFPPPEGQRLRPAITTGLGLGTGGIAALLSGLYEVVERDSAMLAWYSTYEPLGLAVEDDTYPTVARRARSEDLEATALLLTQDIDVPVVCVCVHREDDWPRFAAGMAANLDPAVAARGAIEEAVQNWLELRRMGPETASEQSGAIGRYAAFPPAAQAFVDPDTTVPAASVGPDSVPSGEAELDAVLDRVGDAGLDAYAARLTPRDVASLGFEAVRVVIPAAQPLFSDDPYFGERARTVPRELGFEPWLDRDHHPYP